MSEWKEFGGTKHENGGVDDSGEDWGDVTSPGSEMIESFEAHLTDVFVFAEK